MTGLFLAGVVGCLSLDLPAYYMFCAILGIGIATNFASMFSRRNLQIVGKLPTKAVAGQKLVSGLTINNRSRFGAYDVSLGLFSLPRSISHLDDDIRIPYIAGKKSCSCSISLLPARRGLFEMPNLRVFSTFPLNLLRSGKNSIPVQPLLVLPAFHKLHHIQLPMSPRYQPGGFTLTGDIGESTEYIGNRAYQTGDPLRKIDFKSWARLTSPAVREYQEEYYCRAALILDSHITTRRKCPPEGYRNLEAAVSLTASIAEAMGQGEAIIDIFAAGPELYVLRTGRHTTDMDRILEILACVQPSKANPFTTISPVLADELPHISSAVFIFLHIDETRQRLLQLASESGCKTKVILISESPSAEPVEMINSQVDSFCILSPDDILHGKLETL